MKIAFQDYFKTLIGSEEAEKLFHTIEHKLSAPRSIRVNTLKISKKELSEWFSSQGYTVKNSPYSRDGIELSGSGQEWALKLPYHAGFTYPQDSASMFAVEMLSPQPGERVLDLTAAPGGKSTHMAQRMKNTGVLVANDMDTHRLKALRSNMSRLGIKNSYITRLAAAKMATLYPETFDRILLDPSCSGEGLFVSSEGKPNYWNKKALKHFSGLQFGLLKQAFQMLKPGGRLVYSTCALNAVENDGVLNDFLAKNSEARVDELAVQELQKNKIAIPKQLAGLQGIRFWPQETNTKGFFCIAITKIASQNLPRPEPRIALRVLKKDERAIYDSFLSEHFGISLLDGEWIPYEHHLFLISKDMLEMPPPPGFALALPLLKTYENGEMKPSHEGCVYLSSMASKNLISLSKENMERAMKNEAQVLPDIAEGMYFAKYLNFPIGLLKIGSQRIELLVPKMA